MENSWTVIPSLAFTLALFLAISWHHLALYLAHPGGLALDPLRLALFEPRLPAAALGRLLDSLLSLAAFPLLGSLLLLVEYGAAAALYLAWLWQLCRRPAAPLRLLDVLSAALPPLYLLLIFLFHDVGGGDNFGMRGFIPAQILLVLAAVRYLDHARPPRWFTYLALLLLAAQLASLPLSYLASRFLSPDQAASKYVTEAFDSAGRFPSELAYIRWVNQHTPANAIIIETTCPPDDLLTDANLQRYHWLERLRLLPAACFAAGRLAELDAPFLLPAQFAAWQESAAGQDFAAFALAQDWPPAAPRYLLRWKSQAGDPGAGIIIYEDAYVQIKEPVP